MKVGDLTLTCLDGTAGDIAHSGSGVSVRLPAPFASALDSGLSPSNVWERFDLLGLLDAPTLAGFETASGALSRRLTDRTPPDVLTAGADRPGRSAGHAAAHGAGGRGDCQPGQCRSLSSGGRRARTRYTRGRRSKLPVEQPALLRLDVASALRLAMLQAAAQSPYVSQARRGDLVLYGHSAIAYGGPPPIPFAWFTGFVDRTQGSENAAIVAVVVVEAEDNPGVAAQIAGDSFRGRGRAGIARSVSYSI